jgi:hypothetical protein
MDRRTKMKIITNLMYTVFLLLPLFFIGQNSDAILYYADYEKGNILDEDTYGIDVEKCCDHSVRVKEDIARKGDHSVRFESRLDDPEVAGSPGRAELTVKKTEPITEEWYAWSIYTPKKMKPDIGEILGQWHASPDFNEGEDWRSPPMAVRLRNDKWHISGHYAPQRVNNNDNRKRGFSKNLGRIQKGVWTDWVFHVQWDYRKYSNGGTGFVEVWQQVNGNGYKKVINYEGPIGYNDEEGVYLKWGIYKYSWWDHKGKQKRRIHYYDEVKIGNAEASFDEMKIGQ